jgi:hypothetical protein
VNGPTFIATYALASLGLLTSCRPPREVADAATVPAPMPSIPVYELTQNDSASALTITRSPDRDPLREMGVTKRVTLTASAADARTLLLWLAQEAGVSLVVSPDVNARVSVSFTDVPAAEAMRAVMAEAKLSVLASAMQAPWPPVVFRNLPVNINTASADVIAARFGVSDELAKWLVESRRP